VSVETNLGDDELDRNGEADDIFQRLTGRWVLQILTALNRGQMRFNALRREIPKVSANVLAARLRELESARLIIRTVGPPPAAFHVYELGPLARELRPALYHLEQWKSRLADSGQGDTRDDEQSGPEDQRKGSS